MKRSERVAALRTNLTHGEATDGRVSRLPSWARQYIAELESMILRSADRAQEAVSDRYVNDPTEDGRVTLAGSPDDLLGRGAP